MVLALYKNGMLRLWSLLDARCQFKKKIGLPPSEESESDSYDDEEEETSKNGEKAKSATVLYNHS